MSEIVSPYTPEHGTPDFNSGDRQPGYQPTPDEKKILRRCDELYSKAKKYRKRYDQRWIDWYKMFRGRQWKEVRPSYRHSEVLNMIFEAIQSMVPILTDAKPKLEYLPTLPQHDELADILTKVAANDWEHQNWLYVLTEILVDGHLYGNGFGYIGFNAEAQDGLGAIEFESQDNFYVFPDPQARDINGKRTKHFIIAEPVDVAQVKREYKDNPNAKYIAADVVDFQQGDKADIYQVMFKSPTDSKLIVEGPSGYDSIAKNQTLKLTIWSKEEDYEEEKLDEEDPPDKLLLAGTELEDTSELGDGMPTEDEDRYIQKKLYPYGRKTVVAGGVVLEDGPSPYEDGQFPFVKYTNYILPREFWGVGDVENLDSPQKTINKIISFVLDTLTLMSNPIWIVDDTTGIDTDNIFNKPGLVIEKTAGSEARRESGVDIPPFVLPFLNAYRNFFNGVSGQTDLSKGVEPGNVTAASAIEDLQQAQQTRLRQKARNIDAFLQDFGKLYLSRVFQFYSIPRIIRVSGDENADQFFYFHVEKFDVDPITKEKKPLDKPRAVITSPSGDCKTIEIEGDFDVRVSTGSSLGFEKASRGQMSLEYFRLGIIDEEEVLKNADYPNYEAVLQRVQQKKQQMQQMQMQVAQQMQAAKIQETQSKAAKNMTDAQKNQVESAVLAHPVAQVPHV